ncbi:hypothetical protein GQ600_10299 [Phytophthora cactorum]|nr:hypothetical protein GQ600_10299 [Phytophthora cactorum]
MAKSKYGGPSSFDMDQVEDAVVMLRTRQQRGLHKVPQVPYFMKNWDHQKERWAVYVFRSDVPHLCKHTNNR